MAAAKQQQLGSLRLDKVVSSMFTRKSHSLSSLQGEQQSWRHLMQISSVCYIFIPEVVYSISI